MRKYQTMEVIQEEIPDSGGNTIIGLVELIY
jgi:hypothetical protein